MPNQKEGLKFNPHEYHDNLDTLIIKPKSTKHALLKALINRTVEDETPKSMYFYRKDGSTRHISTTMLREARETKTQIPFVKEAISLASGSQEVVIFLEPTGK